jgi:poly(A) polymerase
MDEVFPFERALPEDAGGALAIVRTLVAAGHQALLAGGCVRDLLLGLIPQDYDVATDAPPERVSALFRPTRHVGAQFGVVLVKQRRQWIEVATFRAEGPYLDGRRPVHVTLSDARHDATRRDFTINGMFLDPVGRQVVDYVGGHADLDARLIRAIGEPAQRFDEDYLRLLRAVRFAARLDYEIEPVTLATIREHAPLLAKVAAERVREELEKMLGHPARQRAWTLCRQCGLLPYLWPGAGWSADEQRVVDAFLARVPPDAPFALVLAVLLARRSRPEIERIARALTLSNEQRETTAWLVAHQAALDDPHGPTLAELKKLMVNRAFGALMVLIRARIQDLANLTSLEKRIAAIPPESVQPPPLVTGDDLLARGLTPGPIYKQLLDALYTRQLNEELCSRPEALAALDHMLRATQ